MQRTYIRPKLNRKIKLSFILVFKFRFQKTQAEKTARNKSAAELKAIKKSDWGSSIMRG